MRVPKETAVKLKSYKSQAGVLVKNYILSDPFIPYISIFGSICAFKLVYDLSQLFSMLYFECFSSLTKIQRIEWNTRATSTIHAIFIGYFALYFVFWSDLFSDHQHTGLITFRSSHLSTFALGGFVVQSSTTSRSLSTLVSVGYFIADLGLISCHYPSLGGKEFIVHHSLSAIAVSYSMISGEGQLYTFMSLISEVTTPEINIRWYLDTAGLKKSIVYLINGVVIFLAWLVARIILFAYMFYHIYLHYDQVHQMHTIGFLLVFIVPSALGTMNLIWFGKILKGLKKTLANR